MHHLVFQAQSAKATLKHLFFLAGFFLHPVVGGALGYHKLVLCPLVVLHLAAVIGSVGALSAFQAFKKT